MRKSIRALLLARGRRKENSLSSRPSAAPAAHHLVTPSPHPPARLGLLGVLLAAAVVAYAATGRWRQQLWEESARSRRAIAALERARAARDQRLDREKGLMAALQSHPDLVEIRLELARLRWEEGGPAAAAAVLQPGGTSLADPRLRRLLAAAQRRMGREDRALSTLDRAVRLAPADGDLRAERAILFSLMGWFPQAEAALREAERRQADPVQIALVRAAMARQQGDLRAARRALESARRLSPQNSDVIEQLAAVSESEGQVAEATHLLESVAQTEADPDACTALAHLYLRASPSMRARAQAAAQQALALRPQMPAARRLLGRCLRLNGDLTGARSVLERLYREQPQREGVALELAHLYRDLGLTDRVAPLLAQHQALLRWHEQMRRAAMAVMTHPDSAPAHREMGRLCLEHGMIGRAILSLERAMALDPRLPGVRELLAAARRTASSGEAEPVELGRSE